MAWEFLTLTNFFKYSILPEVLDSLFNISSRLRISSLASSFDQLFRRISKSLFCSHSSITSTSLFDDISAPNLTKRPFSSGSICSNLIEDVWSRSAVGHLRMRRAWFASIRFPVEHAVLTTSTKAPSVIPHRSSWTFANSRFSHISRTSADLSSAQVILGYLFFHHCSCPRTGP